MMAVCGDIEFGDGNAGLPRAAATTTPSLPTTPPLCANVSIVAEVADAAREWRLSARAEAEEEEEDVAKGEPPPEEAAATPPPPPPPLTARPEEAWKVWGA